VFSLDNFENQAQQVVGDEGMLESAQFVQDDAQGPDIALRCVGLALARFRTHVVWSAHYSHSCCIRFLKDFANTEITQLYGQSSS